MVNPVYPTNIGKTCIINLFLSEVTTAGSYCLPKLLKDTLPIAQYLFDSNWVIISRDSLNLPVVCNGQHTLVRSSSPLDVIKVAPECAVSNMYFSFSTPYIAGKSTNSIDHFMELRTVNFSNVQICKTFANTFPKLKEITLQKKIKEIKDLSLDNLVTELRLASIATEEGSESPWKPWHYISIVLALLLICIP